MCFIASLIRGCPDPAWTIPVMTGNHLSCFRPRWPTFFWISLTIGYFLFFIMFHETFNSQELPSIGTLEPMSSPSSAWQPFIYLKTVDTSLLEHKQLYCCSHPACLLPVLYVCAMHRNKRKLFTTSFSPSVLFPKCWCHFAHRYG